MITAQTGYVGIRMPNHPIALDLLQQSGLPVAAPSANKFGHVSPTKAEHVYKDFHQDSEVLIIDGGCCSFGIESTVIKLTESENKYQLTIIRKGGVSIESLKKVVGDLGLSDACNISQLATKHSKEETENLEAPGQFLRHYSPDIVSYLFKGEITRSDLKMAESVFIDFGATFKDKREQVKYYMDLSEEGNYVEAIGKVYDVLRWAETKQDCSSVLITNLLELSSGNQNGYGREHMEALFDRLFRATSGQEA